MTRDSSISTYSQTESFHSSYTLAVSNEGTGSGKRSTSSESFPLTSPPLRSMSSRAPSTHQHQQGKLVTRQSSLNKKHSESLRILSGQEDLETEASVYDGSDLDDEVMV